MIHFLVSSVGDKLKTVLRDEVDLLVGVTSEIQNLSSMFTLIQKVLKDAETRQVENEAVKQWLENLKDVAYDVDDILDEWTTEALRRQAPDEGDVSCFSFLVTCFLFPVTCFNNVKLRHEIGSRIKEVRGRLDSIEKEKNQLGLRVDSGERERVDSEVRRAEMGERETGSLPDPFIVGREDVKKRVVDLLVGGSSREVNEVPFVISIVGMGGLGKTTLAQLIYNDENVKGYFDMKMWVCVSNDFDVKRITKLIIESADKSSCQDLSLALLQSRLSQKLQAKRFLLVLDDVWRHDSEKWDMLRRPFQAGAPGSRIIVTTRLEDVAWRMGSTDDHMQKLDVLSDDDCWSVFSRTALEHRSAEERSDLEEIGRQIVNRCGGVPLAAKTIGSACSRKTRRQWELVLRSEVWKSGDVLGGILPALLLSYHDLPPALKQCFTYLSIFPKDWKIEKDKIVKLWEAQGFICSEGTEDMEEIGGLYFEDLLRRSLLQDAELDDDDDQKIVSCKMHDLVHDLAQSVAGSDFSLVQIGNQASLVQIGKQASRVQMVQIGKQASLMQNGKQASLNFNNVRHSLFSSDETVNEADEEGYISATLYKAHKLRTLFLGSRISMVPRMSFHHWRRLRALNLRDSSIKKLSPTVGHLKHLRFLDLSGTDVEELPEEVCNCLNLQTLRLGWCEKLKKLPGGMKKMIHLRFLDLSWTGVEELPEEVCNCLHLQTLSLNHCGELKKLPGGMKKMIQLRFLDLSGTGVEELPEEVCNCLNLQTLRLNYCKELNKLPGGMKKMIHLRFLDLTGTGVEELPEEVCNCLNLQTLRLDYCKKLKKLPGGMKKMIHLRFLDLSGTDVEELPEELCNCLNLQTLRLDLCRKLKKLPGGMKKMINMRHLEFELCFNLKYLPQGIGRLTRLRTVSKFIVGGGNEGCKCEELKHLNDLQGSLEITGLDKNRSRDEAREAELNKKQHLHTLSFKYTDDPFGELLDEEVKRMEDVLEILQPHTNLKELAIEKYRGSTLPKWIEDPVFSHLVSITLSFCRECKQLPGLGKLPSLKYLQIVGMMEVRKVGVEFSGVDNNDGSGCVVSFSKLETLVFRFMTDWEEWELRGGVGEVMPALLQLEVTWCPKLKELPSNLLPLLQKLTLQISNEGKLSSGGTLPVLPNLKHLIIPRSDELKSFPCGWLGQFKALITLEIHYCWNLESLPDEELQQLTMLQELKIEGCPLLKERYGDGGEDRDKIAQIPNISIVE